MTGNLWLDWALIAVSLTNTILLMWLGTTVLFNAERRTWGGWLSTIGLLLGGVFFVSHTAILGYGLNVISVGLKLWWGVGLIAVSLLPFLWYVMMLWYSGFWAEPGNPLARRHKPWFILAGLLLVGLLAIAILTEPTPEQIAYPARGISASILINGLPLILIIYPVYVIICLSLSLDALRKPGPTHRLMGDLARQRARPWLTGASLALWAVSLAVGMVFAWLGRYLQSPTLLPQQITSIGYFDLLIESIIAIAVILLGQAVVAYEIFTGKTLPRQDFFRQWQQAVMLAIGYGLVIGFTFSSNLRPIYGVLLSALLMTFFFGLLSWRTYSERERYIKNLRPFVASQGFYDQLLAPTSQPSAEMSLRTPFNALCEEVLNTRKAMLLAVGPLAPLVGPPLVYPGGQTITIGSLSEITRLLTPETPILPVSDLAPPGLIWAVPLWSQRGLAGVLLLGEKGDNGIYSQEEIEIAQTSCERLIDTKASLEIAQRVMDLQRQRLAESQVLDQRARRVLHDDVLQQLHAAMLKLDRANPQAGGETAEALDELAQVHSQISNLLRAMPSTSLPEIKKLGLVGALRKVVEDELGNAFDSVTWDISPQAESSAANLSPLESEVSYYAAREAIRNAARHGHSTGDGYESLSPLHLTIRINGGAGLTLEIEDNGVGLPVDHTSQPEGGQGLALHSTMMAVIGGELALESEPGKYTRVRLTLTDIHAREPSP